MIVGRRLGMLILYISKRLYGRTSIISYGDLIYENSVITSLLESAGDIILLADSANIQTKRL